MMRAGQVRFVFLAASALGLAGCPLDVAALDVADVSETEQELVQCGDHVCSISENASECPQDCSATCGNGTCAANETHDNCPADCFSGRCGNGTCDEGESSNSCSADCGAVQNQMVAQSYSVDAGNASACGLSYVVALNPSTLKCSDFTGYASGDLFFAPVGASATAAVRTAPVDAATAADPLGTGTPPAPADIEQATRQLQLAIDCAAAAGSTGAKPTTALNLQNYWTDSLLAGDFNKTTGLTGPNGKQGRVTLPAKHYFLYELHMRSNVRLEIAPGATLTNMTLQTVNTKTKTINQNAPLFAFGDEPTLASNKENGDALCRPRTVDRVKNVTIKAVDMNQSHHASCTVALGNCAATYANKPYRTNFRANAPFVDDGTTHLTTYGLSADDSKEAAYRYHYQDNCAGNGTACKGMANLENMRVGTPTGLAILNTNNTNPDHVLKYWAPEIQNMFVVDLDPVYYSYSTAGANCAAGNPIPSSCNLVNRNIFFADIGNTQDVLLDHVFAIQNPRQDQTWGSHNPVIVMRPPEGATDECTSMASCTNPANVDMSWFFSILSPGGAGTVQITSCLTTNSAVPASGCEFNNLFGHGGVTLRLESNAYDHDADNTCQTYTDNVATGHYLGATNGELTNAPASADDGTWFTNGTFSKITNLIGNHIENANGNAAVYLTPHCRVHGKVTISNVRAIATRVAVVADYQGTTNRGSFLNGSSVSYVSLIRPISSTPYAAVTKGQDNDPDLNVSKLSDGRAALDIKGAANKPTLNGDICLDSGTTNVRQSNSAGYAVGTTPTSIRDATPKLFYKGGIAPTLNTVATGQCTNGNAACGLDTCDNANNIAGLWN